MVVSGVTDLLCLQDIVSLNKAALFLQKHII